MFRKMSVEITHPELYQLVDESVWIGQAFVLIDASALDSGLRGSLTELLGPAHAGRYLLPAQGEQQLTTLGFTVRATPLTPLALASLTTDRMLYRQGCDTVHLVAFNPTARGGEQTVAIRTGGSVWTHRTLRFDEFGLATLQLVDLPTGEYSLEWEHQPADRRVTFSVVEYQLAPLVATIVKTSSHGAKLSVVLQLESFGMPVNGRVHVQLKDRWNSCSEMNVSAVDGRAGALLSLSGAGPHTIDVYLHDDPSRTASVALLGSRGEDREPTLFSQLGEIVHGALLPGESSRAVRGIYLSTTGYEASPLVLERVDSHRVRLVAIQDLEAVCVRVGDPLDASQQQVPHRSLREGEAIDVELTGVLGLVQVAAFIDGLPWEGQAAVLAPCELNPQLNLQLSPANDPAIAAGETLQITIQAHANAGEAYLVVKDARLPASDTIACQLASEIKGYVAANVKQSRRSLPKALWAYHDVLGFLVHDGVISREQLVEVLQCAAWAKISKTDALLRMGYATRDEMIEAMTRSVGVDCVDLHDEVIPDCVIELMPESVARENVVLPLAGDENSLTVVMSNPDDLETLDKLRFIMNRPIRVVLAPREDILDAINRYYGMISGESADSILQEFTDTAIDFTSCASDGGFLRREQNPIERVRDNAAVVFVGIVPLQDGQATISLPFTSRNVRYRAEVFVLSKPGTRLDWGEAQAEFLSDQRPAVELLVPPLIHHLDGARGTVRATCQSGTMRVQLTCDGHGVALWPVGQSCPVGKIIESQEALLEFRAVAGCYEATVIDLVTGASHTQSAEIGLPGQIERLARTLHLVQPGETFSRAFDERIVALRLLPNVQGSLGSLVEATSSFQHCCCEQTAAKLLAAVMMYAAAHDSPARRQKAGSMILAGVDRQETMWLQGRGFKSYPDNRDEVESYLGPMAARHLHWVALLGRELVDVPLEVKQAIGRAQKMARDVSEACRIEWPPRVLRTAQDAYVRICHSDDPTQWLEPLDWLRKHCHASASTAVDTRVWKAYAAAALLHADVPDDQPTAMQLANAVMKDLRPEGRFYSTIDSIAAVAMLSELGATRCEQGDQVRVNGNESSWAEAACLDLETIVAARSPLLVEVAKIVSEDWNALTSNVRLHASIERDLHVRSQVALAHTCDLYVRLPSGYQAGDLLWISLPPSLARIEGGGQVKHFSVDLRGQSSLRVPLLATARSVSRNGEPATNRLLVCLRNMYDEERVGMLPPMEIEVV